MSVREHVTRRHQPWKNWKGMTLASLTTLSNPKPAKAGSGDSAGDALTLAGRLSACVGACGAATDGAGLDDGCATLAAEISAGDA